MYGEVEEHVFHHVESQLADRFFTWGWRRRPSDVPFLALRLMKPTREAIRRERNPSRWIYMNVRQPFPWLLEATLATQERFFASLGDDEARRVTIRPRVNKGGDPAEQVGDRIRRRTVRLDDGRTRWESLAGQAELVVLDAFPSTAFMECLTAGVPVIALVPESTAFTEIAAPYYDQAFADGVLHASPESAAQFVNDLDVAAWWAAVRGRDWFTDYLHTFCRMQLQA
jgi:putative transferase (TIGR04331 family)